MVWTSFTFTHETLNRRFCERLELVDDKITSNKKRHSKMYTKG